MARNGCSRTIKLVGYSGVVTLVLWQTWNRTNVLKTTLSLDHFKVASNVTTSTTMAKTLSFSSSGMVAAGSAHHSFNTSGHQDSNPVPHGSAPLSSSFVSDVSVKQDSAKVSSSKPSTPDLPLCYSSLSSRFLPLDGDWVENYVDPSSDHLPYWNLSCPFEFSKYSCVTQAKHQQAMKAATTRFVPRSCRFATSRDGDDGVTNLAKLLEGRRVVLHGDSLLRQIHISLGCLLHARGVLTHVDIQWPTCTNDTGLDNATEKSLLSKAELVERRNACPEGLVNCRLCGPHSSVHKDAITIHLGRNATLAVQYFKDKDLEALTARDILITEAGAHGSDKVTTKRLRRKLGTYMEAQQENRPILIHVITWSSHFATEEGRYQPTFLEAKKQANESLQCRSSVPLDRMAMELNVMGEPKWNINNVTTSMLHLFAGVVWINGTNDQGHAKVGQGGGPYNDCQHFCQPGPPDEFARALGTLLLQVLVSDSTTSANVATYGDYNNHTAS